MHINSIEIKNFRVFDSLKVDDFSQINIILGRNNSGKTSLMEAILFSISSTYPLALFELNQIREVNERSLASLQSFFYSLSFDNAPIIKASFSDDKQEQQRSIYLKATTEALSITTNGAQTDYKREPVVSFMPAVSINQVTVTTSYPDENRTVENTITFDLDNRTLISKQSAVDLSVAAVFLAANATAEPTLSRVGYLKKIRRDQPLIDLLQQIDSRIKDIQVIGDKLYFDINGVAELLPFSLIGDGIKKIVSVMASIIETNASTIILIDEIENGLHYSSHLKLWEALLTVASHLGTQLFVTTHNAETLRYLHKALEKHEVMQPKVRLYDLVKTKKAGFQAYKYAYEGFSNALENETEIRL